jgi:hypothetical protein
MNAVPGNQVEHQVFLAISTQSKHKLSLKHFIGFINSTGYKANAVLFQNHKRLHFLKERIEAVNVHRNRAVAAPQPEFAIGIYSGNSGPERNLKSEKERIGQQDNA